MSEDISGFIGSCFMALSVFLCIGSEFKSAVVFLALSIVFFYWNKKTEKILKK